MAYDLTDFEPAVATAPASAIPAAPDLSDFEPTSSPIAAKATPSTSPAAHDVSDFEPAEPKQPTDAERAKDFGTVEATPRSAYESIRRHFSGLLGPTEKEKIADAVPWGTDVNGNPMYQYKPLGSRMDREQGLFTPYLHVEPMQPDEKDSHLSAVGKALFNIASGIEGSVLSPGGIATSAATGPAARIMGGAFSADMLSGVKEQIESANKSTDFQGKLQGYLGAAVSLGMAALGIKHAVSPTKPQIVQHINTVPDAILHEAASGAADKDIAAAAQTELQKRAQGVQTEVEPVLTKLPGDTQDKVRSIIAKQAAGEPLNENERATLIQVQSFAAQNAAGQTAGEFTSPTGFPPASTPATAAPAGTTSDIPGGSPPAKGNLFAQARQEQAAQTVAPLVQSAEAAKEVAPAAAQAAEEAAQVIAEKVAEAPTAKTFTSDLGKVISTNRRAGTRLVLSDGSTETLNPLGGIDENGIQTTNGFVDVSAVKKVIDPEGNTVWEKPVKTEANPVGTKIVGPAIVGEDGKVIAQGEIGTKHADLKTAEIQKGSPDAVDASHAFVDDQGNVLNREQAWGLAKKSGQIAPETLAAQERGQIAPELHSENLIGEQKEPAPAPAPQRRFKQEAIPDVLKELEEAPTPTEPSATPAPTEPPIDKAEAATATRGIPGALGDAVRDVLLNDKTVEDAAADNGTTVAKVQDSVNRMRRYLADKSAKAKPVEELAPATAEPKRIWQKTRDEAREDGSLAKHRIAVRDAVTKGEHVPLEVLEDFKGSPWADAAREKLYGQQISDTLLGKILKGLTNEGNTLYSDPLFINAVGKPVLRAAVKILQEGIEAGKLGADAIRDAMGYLREHIPDLNEQKANEFFDQFFENEPEKQPLPESPRVETPDQPRDELPPKTEATSTAGTEDARAVGDGGQRITSTKNAVVDAERVARGEPPLMSEASKSLGATWDEAMRQTDLNKNLAPDLVKEINSKPRTIGAVEEAVLLHHKIEVMNDLSKNTKVALDENADAGDRAEARITAARLMDELNSIDEATRKAGTEWGRTGRFRQVLAAEDYSLVRMLQRAELAKQRPLTEAEQVQVQKMSERIKELEAKVAEHEQQRDAQRETEKNAAVDEFVQNASKPLTEADKYAQGILERIQNGLKSEADKARARIHARLGKASAGVDPTVIYDVAVIGAEKLFSTGLDFARWSAEAIKDIRTTFGESFANEIEPHMQEVFDRAKVINDDAVEKGAPKKVREKIKPKNDAEARDAVVQVIKDRAGAKEALGGQIQKLAENFVRSGIIDRDALVAAVHDAVKEALPEATPRDIRDAISGYGDYKELNQDEVKVKLRDLKGQMQQVSKIEDLESGKLPRKTGVQRRDPSAEERVLSQEVNRLKKELGLDQTDPDSLKGAMDAVKTRLKNRIEDLQRAIEKKEKLPGKGKKLEDDAETAQLRRDKDALQQEYDDIFAEPKLTSEQIALKVYKTRTAKRIADLQDRVKRGDFSPKPRKLITLDTEGQKLKEDAERAKLEFDRAAYKDMQSNRPTWEKVIDYIPKLSRAVLLSSPMTVAKLTAAALWRMSVTPLEELIGSGINKIPGISEVAARAPREGGGVNVRSEARAITDAVTLGMKDAGQKLFRGETDLDVTGGKRSIIPHELIDFFGNIHGALKAPVVRAEFARSFEKRMAFNIANGVDVTDPLVMSRISVEAYKDSQKAIFMQDNRVVSAWSNAMKQLGLPSKVTGRPTIGGKIGQAVGKTLLPIVKIPTNIVAEAFQYATGAVTGSARVAAAFRRGVETLKPEEADLIMRELKKGSLGSAVMLLGFLAPQVIGGYYQSGKHRPESDVKPGGARLYGVNIPPLVLHNPAVEMLQVGATVRRVADSKLRVHDRESQGVPAGILAAGLGLIEEVPFINESTQIATVFNPYERTKFFGELARSRVEPQLMQYLAQQGDKSGVSGPEAALPWKGDVRKRAPETFKDQMKVGVPGLRQQVPLKKKKAYSGLSR